MNKSYLYYLLFVLLNGSVEILHPNFSYSQTISFDSIQVENYTYAYPPLYSDYHDYIQLVNTDKTATTTYYQHIPTPSSELQIKQDLYRGFYYHRVGEFDSLEIVLNQIEGNYDTLTYPFVHYSWLRLRGSNQYNLGNYAKAKDITERVAQLPITQQTPEFTAQINGLKGFIHAFSGHFELAIEDFSLALTAATAGQDSVSLARLWNGLGITYCEIGENDISLQYFQQAFDYYQRNNLMMGIEVANNLAVFYERLKQWDKSYQYLLLALKLHKKYRNERGIFMRMNNLGLYHLKVGSLDSAEHYIKQALQLVHAQENQKQIAFINFTYASLLLEKGNWQRAKTLGEDMINTGYSTNNHILRVRGYLILAEVAEFRKNWKTATTFYKKHYALKDSVLKANNSEKITRLEERFLLKRKDLEIDHLSQVNLLQKEKLTANRKQGYLLLILLGISVIAALFGINYFRQRNRLLKQKQQLHQEERRNLTLSAQAAEAEHALEVEKRQRLEENMAQRNRELAANALSLTNKNDVLDKLLQTLRKADQGNWKSVYRELESSIRTNIDSDRNWEVIKIHFERVYPQFFDALRERHSELSQNDIRHIVYLKMEMSAKEVARMLNINPSSVDMVRYRLKKKLNLCRNTKLIDYLNQLEQETVI